MPAIMKGLMKDRKVLTGSYTRDIVVNIYDEDAPSRLQRNLLQARFQKYFKEAFKNASPRPRTHL